MNFGYGLKFHPTESNPVRAGCGVRIVPARAVSVKFVFVSDLLQGRPFLKMLTEASGTVSINIQRANSMDRDLSVQDFGDKMVESIGAGGPGVEVK